MWKRFILWDYSRATWQYDLMVGIIVAFIFLTPRAWFRDQPRIHQASSIAMLPTENGGLVYFVDTALLSRIPENQRADKLSEMLQVRTGNRHLKVTRVEPILDAEGELEGYMAFARP
jgi:hypothetical protein